MNITSSIRQLQAAYLREALASGSWVKIDRGYRRITGETATKEARGWVLSNDPKWVWRSAWAAMSKADYQRSQAA